MASRITIRIASLLFACTILLAAFPTALAEQSGVGWSFADDGTLTLTGATGLNAVPIAFDLTQARALHLDKSVKTFLLSEKRPRLLPDHIEVNGENPYFTVDSGLMIDTRENKIVCAQNDCSRVAIPGYVRAIGPYAFAGHDVLISVRLPETLQAIGDGAFMACGGLESVTIPENAALGSRIFADCGALSTAVFADGATETGVATFENCTELKSVQFPDSIQTIGERAFFGCESLKVGRLPASLQTVEASAFAACWALDAVDFPDAVVVGPDVLPYPVRHDVPQARSGKGWSFTADGTLTLTEERGLHAVPLDFFWDEVRQLRLSKQVATFFLCNDIPCFLPQTIWVNPENPYFTVSNGLLIRKEDATVVCAEEGVTHVVVPEGVEVIGLCAFSQHARLTSVALPDTLRMIDEGGFDGCTSLTSVRLPEKLEVIGTLAFAGCSGLTDVTIPAGADLYSGAFDGCTSLVRARFAEGAVETGRATFADCAALTDVTLPDTIRAIGMCTFENCTSLQTLALPSALTMIEERAFTGCTGLSALDIPDSVTVAPDALPYATPTAEPTATATSFPATPAPDMPAQRPKNKRALTPIAVAGAIVLVAMAIMIVWRRGRKTR